MDDIPAFYLTACCMTALLLCVCINPQESLYVINMEDLVPHRIYLDHDPPQVPINRRGPHLIKASQM